MAMAKMAKAASAQQHAALATASAAAQAAERRHRIELGCLRQALDEERSRLEAQRAEASAREGAHAAEVARGATLEAQLKEAQAEAAAAAAAHGVALASKEAEVERRLAELHEWARGQARATRRLLKRERADARAALAAADAFALEKTVACLLYTSPSPRDKRQSRMPSSA